MAIVTFTNNNLTETGQTSAISIVATAFAIEHDYRILLISTDFGNDTMNDCFNNNFKKRKSNFLGAYTNNKRLDISNGIEGLIRMFASNRASADAVKSFAKPVLTDRLDILTAPRTKDIKDYENMSVYFSQIIDTASKEYDIILVDLYRKIPREYRDKILAKSTVVVSGLVQNLSSITSFEELKDANDFYKKNNVLICVDKYNPNSKYTNKNIARLLGEKNIPFVIPYNILFSDYCSEGDIINYVLMARGLTDKEGKDGFMYDSVMKLVEGIDNKRKEAIYGQA